MHTKPKLCSGILPYSQLRPITPNLVNAPSTSLLLSFAFFFLYLLRSCGCCCKTSVICYSLWRGLLSGSLCCCDKTQSRENNIKRRDGGNFNLLLSEKTDNKQKDLSVLLLLHLFLFRHYKIPWFQNFTILACYMSDGCIISSLSRYVEAELRVKSLWEGKNTTSGSAVSDTASHFNCAGFFFCFVLSTSSLRSRAVAITCCTSHSHLHLAIWQTFTTD